VSLLGRVVLGVVGAGLIVCGLLVLQNALSIRGSINELQETFAALFSLVLIAPGLVAMRYAIKGLGLSAARLFVQWRGQ